jgi:hypothetical protein
MPSYSQRIINLLRSNSLRHLVKQTVESGLGNLMNMTCLATNCLTQLTDALLTTIFPLIMVQNQIFVNMSMQLIYKIKENCSIKNNRAQEQLLSRVKVFHNAHWNAIALTMGSIVYINNGIYCLLCGDN